MATISAQHVGESIDFSWRGRLQVSPDARAIRFEFEGKVPRDMEVCRVGLVVLHPVEWLIGSEVTVVGPAVRQVIQVRKGIAPQPIVNGVPGAITKPFSSITIENPNLGRLQLNFEGDLFELEDQRNWGDATFKTYCTPLKLGFPRTLNAGTKISHSLEVCHEPIQSQRSAHSMLRGKQERDLQKSQTGRFPLIGRQGMPAGGQPAWRHIQIDLSRPGAGAEFTPALLDVLTDTKLEIGVPEDALADLPNSLRKSQERIARILVYGAGPAAPCAQAVSRWRESLNQPGAPAIPVLAAARGYFVEFNRGVSWESDSESIAFPLTATVHGEDALTIAENVGTVFDIAETARALTHSESLAIAVAPLALHYPAKMPRRFPREMFAPWCAATLMHCAAAQIASVTLADDLVQALTSIGSGEEFLARLVECSGLRVVPLEAHMPVDAHAPTGLHVGVLERSRGARAAQLLVVNLTDRLGALSLLGTPIRALSGRHAFGPAPLRASPELVEVPAFGVAWVDVERVGCCLP
jgi:hypothetical protein